MAVCDECGREMLTAKSCSDWKLHVNGQQLTMISFGRETMYGPDYAAARPCHDCGVSTGGFHHPGCDWAQCPHCGEQLLSCDCEFDEDED